MRDTCQLIARGGAALLLVAAALKSISFAMVSAWFGDAIGVDGPRAGGITAAVIGVEGAVGLFALLRPRNAAVVAGCLFGAFALLHSAMLITGTAWRCPCFGEAAGHIAAYGANLWLLAVCATTFVANACLVYESVLTRRFR